jgi:hypothetical protein
MFESVIEFLKNAVKEHIVGDPVWATIALIGQFVFASRFIKQRHNDGTVD